MYKVRILIDRIVSPETFAILSGILPVLEEGDVFDVKGGFGAPSEKLAPMPPSKPKIIRKRRSWKERVRDAFIVASRSNKDVAEKIDVAFGWEEEDLVKWRPYSVTEIAEIAKVGDRDKVLAVVLVVLTGLGRQPDALADKFVLPPTTEEYLANLEKEEKERERENLEFSGDPHIGIPKRSSGDATVDIGVLSSVLGALDWESKERTELTYEEFFRWANIPHTHGNTTRLACAARKFGGIKRGRKNALGKYMMIFPLPKGGKSFFDDQV